MNCIKKGIFGFLITTLLLLIFTPVHTYAGEDKYGVKIGNQEDGYKLYENLIVISPNKNIMVKAEAICKELGFKYTYNSRTKKLTISDGAYLSIVFTVGSKYYYINYFSEDKKKATYQCYYDKASKSYVIPMDIFKTIVGYQYCKLPYNDYYSKQGYKGMFFLSSDDRRGPSKEFMLTDNLADQIVAEEVTENMTDVEKVKVLNDYMGLYFKSDFVMLVTGQVNCNIYAEAYHLLLTKAGITDCIIYGDHAWNMVKLENDYYHVDTYWNDTGYGYFLLSDKVISEDHVWDSSIYPACNKGLSRNDGRRVEMLGDDFYSVIEDYDNDRFSLFRTKYDGTDRTLLLEIEYQKYLPAFCFDDNNFYYATLEKGVKFYKLDLKTNTTEEIFSDSSLKYGEFAVHNEYIYMYYIDRIIRINMKTKEQQNLYEEAADNVNIYFLDIVDDKVIFDNSKYDETPVITKRYQMNLDGTGLNKLSW